LSFDIFEKKCRATRAVD